jgi:hypothetical protein
MTLMPMPSTTCSTRSPADPASARIPASFRGGRPLTQTSFGHFTCVSSPVAAAMPSDTASPAAIVSSPTARASGRSTALT